MIHVQNLFTNATSLMEASRGIARENEYIAKKIEKFSK